MAAQDETFETAIRLVLQHEGGYVNDPDDPGGETNFGISRRTYPDLDIKNLTGEEATEIYRRDWWDKNRFGEIEPGSLATGLFDVAVNAGTSRAVTALQKALTATGVSVSVDGKLGPATLAAANGHAKPDALVREFCAQRVMYYTGLEKPKYLLGWVRRALDCL